jgi:hypothetical protein
MKDMVIEELTYTINRSTRLQGCKAVMNHLERFLLAAVKYCEGRYSSLL